MIHNQKNNYHNEDSIQEELIVIKKILAGDSASFKYLQKKYKKIIVALIRKMIRNEDDVDDLTQETFIKAYNALPTFQLGFSFSAWLYRIASNTCIDFLRKKRFPTISLSQPISDSDDDLFFEIEDDSYVPDVEMMNDERKKILEHAINELPQNYREIIRLRHEEELDYIEISQKLDLPLGTVKAHLFRARKILLVSLKKHSHIFND
jgi:RNA polymerase sigma factor (sigma-70 family)